MSPNLNHMTKLDSISITGTMKKKSSLDLKFK